MREFVFEITEETAGERLDKVLSSEAADLSRSYIQKQIKDGRALVNGKPQKASFIPSCGDMISFTVPDAASPEVLPEDIPLDVAYEDDDVIVINKPKGMVVHPAPGHASGTLVNALLHHCAGSLSGINGVLRPGIVHRIDRDTTGLLIACKNDLAHASIAAQLKEHSIERKYLALVQGSLPQTVGTVDAPIGRNERDRLKMAAGVRGGREAVTHYEVLETFPGYSFVACRLETGRTHQIRVHLSSIGHPLVGDTLYGAGKSPFQTEGQCLHAAVLGFTHPRTGERIRLEAPLPAYFEDILARLRK
ncbi:MAG: RluA family pseudouridine synthase [Lachnospiraceae bacterium]|nr:RluA family pseudouridine synthase [Lachnospiraceae bacterium]